MINLKYWKNTTITLILKTFNQKISGVLHPKKSIQHYHLRRYQPAPELASLVDQFWFVSWDLRGQPEHIQQNLPDPNMHLVISKQGAKVMGPVSKKYSFTMQGQSKIIGVKFNLGALVEHLSCCASDAVDKEFELKNLFAFDQQELQKQALNNTDDETVIKHLTLCLLDYLPSSTKQLRIAQTQVEQIKTNNNINRVEQLADLSHTSVRNLQRLFKTYVGLSPKWLIRKYRLHHAMTMLEEHNISFTELATRLDYSDQSHLIRDFNEFLNITPRQYALALEQGIKLSQ